MSVQQSTSPLKVRVASIVLFILVSVTLDQRGVAAELGGRDCVEYQATNSGTIACMCVLYSAWASSSVIGR